MIGKKTKSLLKYTYDFEHSESAVLAGNKEFSVGLSLSNVIGK